MQKLDSAEGATPLDEDETEGLIPSHISLQEQLNEWEAANILKATGLIRGARESRVLTEPFVRELHRKMFGDTWTWAGKYRRTDKNIGIHWPGIQDAVTQMCHNAIAWRGQKLFSPVEAAVRLHHRLVAIHPFPNGNGRHARLYADTLLRSAGRPVLAWGKLERNDATARKQYLSALRLADNGDFAALIRFCGAA